MATTTTVNLIGSAAPLLSARNLRDCQDFQDPTCRGGVAAVAAHIRHQTSSSNATLICPRLDRQHEFVQSHPSGWNINTQVLNEHFRWNFFTAHPSLLTETRDLKGLQTPDMPLLMTNVDIPPSNSWRPYVESVHFDPITSLALISLEDDSTTTSSNAWSQVESALASLDYIAAQNERQQCGNATTDIAAMSGFSNEPGAQPCWIPVILVYSSTAFDDLVTAVTNHNNAAALIIDWEGKQKAYHTPKVKGDQNVWISSQELTSSKFLQYTITLDLTGRRIYDLIVITDDLNKELPVEWKDRDYAKDIAYLRGLADQAIENDPILGNSNAMPRADTGHCQRRECEVGNLVADSLRWKTGADVAFVLGQPLMGPGWSFGQVRVSNIFETLPTPTTICTGKLTGRALIQVLEHAFRSEKAIVAESQNNSTAILPTEARFLQVSGLQVVYNEDLQNSPNLVSVKVYDKNQQAFLNVNPLRLYEFVTEQDLCSDDSSFTIMPLLSENGIRSSDGGSDGQVMIGSTLLQNSVGDYVENLGSTYVPMLEARLVNDVTATTPVDASSTSLGSCPEGTFWEQEQQRCLGCPSSRAHVTLSDTRVDYKFQNGTSEPQLGRVVVVNRDLHDFVLTSKNTPEWFQFTGATSLASESSSHPTLWPDAPLKLPSGEQIAFDYEINTTNVGVGVTFGTVYFNISQSESLPGCFSERHALGLDTLLQVTPSDQMTDLGYHAIIGLVLMSVILFTCTGLGIWVFVKRERWGYGNLGDKSIKSIQPLYLGTISFGTFVMALTITALSVDEGFASDSSCCKLCVVGPWLLSLGFTLVFSALLSKLMTAKKIAMNPNERTIQVSYKDLLMPFITLFIINFAILFMMLIDPPTWSQQAMEGEDWKLYGFCDYGALSSSLLIASGAMHFLTLAYTCLQSYRVSSLSEDFRELKNIGLAVFLWFQIVLVATPVWFIFDDGDVTGRYYFKVVTLCLLCWSMLLSIFVPVLTKGTVRVEEHPPPKSEFHAAEESPSLFGGFLGFAGSVAGSNRVPIEVMDDEEIPYEEQNRCLADRLCY